MHMCSIGCACLCKHNMWHTFIIIIILCLSLPWFCIGMNMVNIVRAIIFFCYFSTVAIFEFFIHIKFYLFFPRNYFTLFNVCAGIYQMHTFKKTYTNFRHRLSFFAVSQEYTILSLDMFGIMTTTSFIFFPNIR